MVAGENEVNASQSKSKWRAIHIRKGNLLNNNGNSMQLYKAMVYLWCVFVLDPVTHRKLQNYSKE